MTELFHFYLGAWQDHKVTSLSYASWTLWFLGYPDQAQQKIEEALILAQKLAHTFSLAFALNFSAALNLFLRNIQAVHKQTEALLTLAREQGFPFWLTLGTIYRGWALAEQRQVKEGIAWMRQGMVASRATGTELTMSSILARLAEAYGKRRQDEEGLVLLAEALDHVDKSGERVYEAEVYRLKGELVLQSAVHSPQSKQVSGTLVIQTKR
jgi:predicted ATPase